MFTVTVLLLMAAGLFAKLVWPKFPFALTAAGLAIVLFVSLAHAQQQPTPAELNEMRQIKLSVIQQNLDQAYLALTRAQAENARLARENAGWAEYAKPLYAAPAETPKP